MTDQQRTIGKQIKTRLLEQIPEAYTLRVGYRLNVNDAIPPVITHDKDLDAFITKDGENFAFIKIELRSTYFYCESDEKRYPHYAKLAKDAGFSYAVIFREYGDRDGFLMRDLRKGLSITSFVPGIMNHLR